MYKRQILGRCSKEGMIAWSGNFLEDFYRQGGNEQDLYLLFADTDSSEGRRAGERYKRAVYERMSRAYYRQIADWCAAHGLSLIHI